MRAVAGTLALVLALAACAGGEEATPAAGVIPQEALQRLRPPIEPVKALAGGQPSMEALAREAVRAIATSDTLALRRMWVDRPEWESVYFPTSIYARPPYEMPLEVQWQLSLASSEKGLVRLLRRLGGEPLAFESVRCLREPERQGANRLWRDCSVTFRQGGTLLTRILYRGALERDGSFEVLSWANDF